MADTNRIQVKLGNAEFSAEGPQEFVQGAYADFLKALTSPPDSPVVHADHQVDGDSSITGSIDRTYLSRVFQVDNDGLVSLRVLPNTESAAADAALLVLYGSKMLANLDQVLVTRLKKSLERSGIKVDRVDETVAPHRASLIKGGARVGSKYGLNNQGIRAAELIIRRVLGVGE